MGIVDREATTEELAALGFAPAHACAPCAARRGSSEGRFTTPVSGLAAAPEATSDRVPPSENLELLRRSYDELHKLVADARTAYSDRCEGLLATVKQKAAEAVGIHVPCPDLKTLVGALDNAVVVFGRSLDAAKADASVVTPAWIAKTRDGLDAIAKQANDAIEMGRGSLLAQYSSGLFYDLQDAAAHPERLANAIVSTYLPDSIRDRTVNALVETEKLLDSVRESYRTAKAYGAPADKLADLAAKYDAAFIDHHEWKFWAMSLPVFSARLKGKVRPPSIDLLRKTSKKIDLLGKLAPDYVASLRASGVVVDAEPAERALGFAVPVGAAGVALVVAGGIVAIVALTAVVQGIQAIADGISEAAAVACEASGKCPPGTADKVAKAHADRPRFNPLGDVANIAKYLAIGAGVLGATYVGMKLLGLRRAVSSAPPLPPGQPAIPMRKVAGQWEPKPAPVPVPTAGLLLPAGKRKRKRKSAKAATRTNRKAAAAAGDK